MIFDSPRALNQLATFLERTFGKRCRVSIYDCLTKSLVYPPERPVEDPQWYDGLAMAAEAEAGRVYQSLYRDKNGELFQLSATLLPFTADDSSYLLLIEQSQREYEELLQKVYALSQIPAPMAQGEEPPLAQTSETVEQKVRHAIAYQLGRIYTDRPIPEKLSQNDKLEVTRFLLQSGIFQIKGVIGVIAKQLQCSEASIYRYLSKVQKE